MNGDVNYRNEAEMEKLRHIASSANDGPVLMLNLNRYTAQAGFPNGEIYCEYMSVLEDFLPVVGARILWRNPVLGQATGEQPIDEILAAWYPTHQAFLDLPTAPGAERNFSLRKQAVV